MASGLAAIVAVFRQLDDAAESHYFEIAEALEEIIEGWKSYHCRGSSMLDWVLTCIGDCSDKPKSAVDADGKEAWLPAEDGGGCRDGCGTDDGCIVALLDEPGIAWAADAGSRKRP